MTNKPLPKGYKLAPTTSAITLTDEYPHWTVGDFIEMLTEYPKDARLWLIDSWPEDDDADLPVRPVESIYASEGEVFF